MSFWKSLLFNLLFMLGIVFATKSEPVYYIPGLIMLTFWLSMLDRYLIFDIAKFKTIFIESVQEVLSEGQDKDSETP